MSRIIKSALFAALVLPTAAQAADTFNVTFEAPRVQASTAGFAFKGVETFDRQATGTNRTFTTDFGTGGVISGTYRNVQISGHGVYGGAGGVGNYAVTWDSTGYSLDLTTTDARGINYFGFWLSALDRGNQLSFQKGGATVFTFSSAQVASLLSGNAAYAGNPNGGGNTGEPYAFLNFYDTNGTFDRVLFTENPTVGGYESDNHTVGFFTAPSGTAVPEPASWAMMIVGVGAVGGTLRRRQARARVAVA